jgi:integrase
VRVRSTDLVFTWEDGRPPHPDVIRQRFQRLAARLGLRVIRLHDLRHTYATIALAAGANPKVVSERLGHASVAFTLRLYSHVLPSVDEEAAKRVADLMLPAEPVPSFVPEEDPDSDQGVHPEDERPDQSGSGGRI